MLSRLRLALVTARHQWHMATTPVQPLYDGFRTPVLTREERLEARRQQAQRYVAQNVRKFHVERLT